MCRCCITIPSHPKYDYDGNKYMVCTNLPVYCIILLYTDDSAPSDEDAPKHQQAGCAIFVFSSCYTWWLLPLLVSEPCYNSMKSRKCNILVIPIRHMRRQTAVVVNVSCYSAPKVLLGTYAWLHFPLTSIYRYVTDISYSSSTLDVRTG